jgi:hypothetical protein
MQVPFMMLAAGKADPLAPADVVDGLPPLMGNSYTAVVPVVLLSLTVLLVFVAPTGSAWFYIVIAGCFLLLTVSTLLLGAVQQRIVVGNDGVGVRWFGFGKFVPYTSIEGTEPYQSWSIHGVRLIVRDGDSVKIPLLCARDRIDGTPAPVGRELMALMHRIDRRNEAARGGPVPMVGRVLAEGKDAGSYRQGKVSTEEQWSVLADLTKSPRARAAAALHLPTPLEEEDRARLLTLATATAHGSLAKVLGQVAKGKAVPQKWLEKME